MNLREKRELFEMNYLSVYAVKSGQSTGRLKPITECDIRTCFQKDRDRIIHSKAFRRLKHKTQVFLAPRGDHYRTRLTHTLEVAQIARTIARALDLNEDLTEAISLGHDLGHTPFGHTGEDVLNDIHPGGFEHNMQSLRVVDLLENDTGLNLTNEVRDGIAHHSGSIHPYTLEGQIVHFADRIAYINHDIDDAIRAGVMTDDTIPSGLMRVLGTTHSKRIDTLVSDIIENSTGSPSILMSPVIEDAMLELRDFMFANVYFNNTVIAEEEKARRIVSKLYEYFLEAHDELKGCTDIEKDDENSVCVCDYIAGMTDNYAIELYYKIFMPGAAPPMSYYEMLTGVR